MSSSASRCPSRLALMSETASVTVLPSSGLPAGSEIGVGEGGREQDLQLDRAVRGVDQQVTAAGLEQQLAAATAGQQRLAVARDDRHGAQRSSAGGARGPGTGGVKGRDQAAFGAQGQAVGGV